MMNSKSLLTFILVALSVQLFAQDAYRLTFKIKGIQDSIIYLSNYYGGGQYYKDTAVVNNGEFTFTGKKPLKEGMYSIVANNSRFFDFFVDRQNFSMTTDTADMIKNMKIIGSPENTLFYEYMNYLTGQQKLMASYRAAEKDTNSSKKEKEKLEKQMTELNKEVNDYRKNFFEKNKESFTAKFLQAMEYPDVPEAPKNKKGEIDSSFAYYYTKAHLFDHIDFNDERFLNSPAYNDKMEYYITKLTPQIPDSIIVAGDYLLSRATNPEIFRYTLSYITSTYEKSEYIGMDAIFVHMARKYYLAGKADWVTDKQIKKIKERADALEPLLIGKKAPNIIVKDPSQQKYLQLYDVNAKYTIVYIWSPDCGHCKKSTPVLKKIYDKYKTQGLEVFAVGNDFENETWLKYIEDNNLDWINGSDGGDFTSNFRHLYDVYSTPQTYLLDEEKKILIKKIEVEALDDYIGILIEQDKKANGK
ncbi:TlpA family protein disulfide reductase [Acidiluteibacter ferrifornacis]|uniref:Redoxin domain-containing protein n=1 Tax=Acidiluteibacter ferrifornacis TaxID=2692424 RepID=A0A6N9NFZ6_9FLAO|nr:TlpA family protein disulfide reductase [Acidiluteibacter ferrifornacis]NBG65546.1 redoxin domain-containing protein [Acidiluteibacter ferrifornacis]